MAKITPPSINETAFTCPHCEALTTQYWLYLYAKQLTDDSPSPHLPTQNFKNHILNNPEMDERLKANLVKWCDNMESGLVFFESVSNEYVCEKVENLHLSRCYNCKKVAIWIHDHLLFPMQKAGVIPNVDMPPEIAKDFEEARGIVDSSPRGAAALLRLCVQKLCKYLGEKGKNIDEDIAALVAKGLDPLIQQSLDVVRVIGNEAVHPGTLDLSDDRDTAIHLFDLINAICDQRISHPKKVQTMYGKLPSEKRAAIAKRDSNKPG